MKEALASRAEVGVQWIMLSLLSSFVKWNEKNAIDVELNERSIGIRGAFSAEAPEGKETS